MELSSQHLSGPAMMERSQPSLLQLLVPSSTTALSYQEQKQHQQLAALSAASAAAVAERTFSALTGGRAAAITSLEKAQAAPAAAAPPMMFRDTANAFTAQGSTAQSDAPHAQHVTSAVGCRGEEAEEPWQCDVTASAKATFSLLTRRHSTIQPLPQPPMAAAAAAPAAVAAAPPTADGESASAFSPVRRRSTMFATPFTAGFQGSRRRSTAVSSSLMSDMDAVAEEQESLPAPRPPRRSTLVGGLDPAASGETRRFFAAADDTDGGEARAATHPNGVVALSQRSAAGDDVPVGDYNSNLFTSFDLALYAPDGSAFSAASPPSSALPSPMSQRRRASLKMRSTTLAPVPNACTPAAAGAGPAAPQTGRGFTQSGARRPSQAPQASQHLSTNDGVPRAPRVTFLAGEPLPDAAAALPHSPPASPVPSKAGSSRSSCGEGVASGGGDDKAAAGDDEDDVTFAGTVMGLTVDNRSTMNSSSAVAFAVANSTPCLLKGEGSCGETSAFSGDSLDASTATQRKSDAMQTLTLPGVATLVAASTTRPPSSSGTGVRSSRPDGRRQSSASSLWSATEEQHRFSASTSASTAVATAPPSEKLQPQLLTIFTTTPPPESHATETGSRKRSSLLGASSSAVSESLRTREPSAVDAMEQQRDSSEQQKASPPTPFFVDGGAAAPRWTQGVRVGGGALGGVARLWALVAQRLRRLYAWCSAAVGGAGRMLLLYIPQLRLFAPAAHSSTAADAATTSAATAEYQRAALAERTRGVDFRALHQHLNDASTVSRPRSSTLGDTKAGVVGGSFADTLHLSFPLSQSASMSAVEQDVWRRSAPSSQVATDLQQTLRDTWSGGANTWFASDAAQEPRTALRTTGRILRRQPTDNSFALSQAAPTSPARSGGGAREASAPHSQRNTSPSSPRLSFAESFAGGYEGFSSVDALHRGALLHTPQGLPPSFTSNTSLARRGPSAESPMSFSRPSFSATAPPRSAILDDAYRTQLYHEFRYPPSCRIGDFSGCVHAYTAMVATSSVGHHMLNWKELSLLLSPEDNIDYRDLFPPYHYVTFADFVEFVEVLSVRHRV